MTILEVQISKKILDIAGCILSFIFLSSCWADTGQPNYPHAGYNYKECIVAVDSPKSKNGFGTKGPDWIAIYMIQDNIQNNRGIRHLPGMNQVTDNGFYFYFYETCGEKMKWSKYYVNNFIETHGKKYYYQLKALSPEEVEQIGIREIKKY